MQTASINCEGGVCIFFGYLVVTGPTGGSWVDPCLCSTPGNVASGVIAAATCPSSVFIPVSLFPGAMKQLLTLQKVF